MQTKVADEKEQEAVNRFLRGEILADGSETEGFVVGEGEDSWIQSWVQSVNDGWTAEQVCLYKSLDNKPLVCV